MRERINVNNIAMQVSHMVRPDMIAHSCELELALAEDLPTVEGDPIEIQFRGACLVLRPSEAHGLRLEKL